MLGSPARRSRPRYDFFSPVLAVSSFLIICFVYFGAVRGPVGSGLLIAAFFSGLAVYRRARSSTPWF